MRGSGAEDILVAGGVFLPGTANKIFGDRSTYYQALHSLTVLMEVMGSLRWEAFEEWCLAEHKDTNAISNQCKAIAKLVKQVAGVDDLEDSPENLNDVLDEARPSLNAF